MSSRSSCLILIAVLSSGCGSQPATNQKVAGSGSLVSQDQTTHRKTEPDDQSATHISGNTVRPPDAPPTAPVEAAEPPPLRPLDPQTLFDARLQVFAAGRWEIVTDLPATEAGDLLEFALGVEAMLVEAFGELPDRSVLRAFVMVDRERFRRAGVLPSELPNDFHGRIGGRRFWMLAEQPGYYRNHLFAHEAVHLYQLIVAPGSAAWPVSALEGLAERLATHVRSMDGELQFDALPPSRERIPGWGRIETLQSLAKVDWPTVAAVQSLGPADFRAGPEAYAIVWGLARVIPPHRWNMPTTPDDRLRWQLYRDAVDYGVEPLDLLSDRVLGLDGELAFADGWTRIDVPPGRYRVRIGGDASFRRRSAELLDTGPNGANGVLEDGLSYSSDLALFEKVSVGTSVRVTPSGVRFDYFGGHPIGQVVACRPANPGQTFAVANGTTLDLLDGPILVRINRPWAGMSSQTGHYRLRLTADSD